MPKIRYKVSVYNTNIKPPIRAFEKELTTEEAAGFKDMIGCNVTIFPEGITGVILKVVQILETYPI